MTVLVTDYINVYCGPTEYRSQIKSVMLTDAGRKSYQ